MRPQRFYGLHMTEGVAEYRSPNAEPYRVLINENALKEMDATFEGRPVFVDHVDKVDLSDEEKLKNEADGYVVKSFFNKADGKHWAEFIIISQKGFDAILNKKYKLSNAYHPKEFKGGGQWHGVDYAKEISRGEYEHLALVPNPRYKESVILTPEQFKAYNEEKELELSTLKNSKDTNKRENTIMSKFSFWKREKVENSADMEGVIVTLPKSKKEISIEKLVMNADEVEISQMANGDHHVMVGEEKMKVNDLMDKYVSCKNELDEMKKKNASVPEDEEAKKKALELAAHEEKELAEKKANEAKAAEEKKQNDLKHFESLKNAQDGMKVPMVKVDLSMDKVARGQKRYGSN